MSSHAPYELPKEDRTLNLNDGFDKNTVGKYFQAIHYTDSAIGNFLNELEAKGVLKNTVVVIYGDHTSLHKYYADKVAKTRPYEDWWDNEDKGIPLLIYSPDIQGQKVDIPGGQIDLLPTISYLMGIDKEKYQNKALGKVLLNTNKDYSILNNFNIVGKATEQEKDHAREGILLSDKMVQSDYFKAK